MKTHMAEEKVKNALLPERSAAPVANCVPAQASTLLGLTLVANCEETLAAVRTAVLLARNFKTSLYVNVRERTILFDFSGARAGIKPGSNDHRSGLGQTGVKAKFAAAEERSRSEQPEWNQSEWHQLEAGLHVLDSSPAAKFVLQFDFTAASIFSAGNIWMRVRSMGENLPTR